MPQNAESIYGTSFWTVYHGPYVRRATNAREVHKYTDVTVTF